MSVLDPDCPFHLAHRMGMEVIGSTRRMPIPVLYVEEHHLVVVSPGYDAAAYRAAADWLLAEAAQRLATA